MGFSERLDTWCERKRKAKNSSKFFDLNTWLNGSSMNVYMEYYGMYDQEKSWNWRQYISDSM